MQPKILIVEDDYAIRDMYRMKLQNSGFSVAVAVHGEEGLRVAEVWRPDLILLDLRMPVMSGEEMLQNLRSTDWGSSIRVIALTNVSKDEAPMGLRFLNVNRYLVKAHHTPTQVVQIVHEVLNSVK